MPTSGGAAGLARLYPPSPLRQEDRRLQEPSCCSSLLQFCLLSPAAAPAQEGSAALAAGCAQVQLQLQQAPPTKLHSQNMTGVPHLREVGMDSNLKTGQNNVSTLCHKMIVALSLLHLFVGWLGCYAHSLLSQCSQPAP